MFSFNSKGAITSESKKLTDAYEKYKNLRAFKSAKKEIYTGLLIGYTGNPIGLDKSQYHPNNIGLPPPISTVGYFHTVYTPLEHAYTSEVFKDSKCDDGIYWLNVNIYGVENNSINNKSIRGECWIPYINLNIPQVNPDNIRIVPDPDAKIDTQTKIYNITDAIEIDTLPPLPPVISLKHPLMTQLEEALKKRAKRITKQNLCVFSTVVRAKRWANHAKKNISIQGKPVDSFGRREENFEPKTRHNSNTRERNGGGRRTKRNKRSTRRKTR